ncbi:superoxide dismutase family protein [Sphingosinithalassobacter tenebrarum]|uniref:Superoxide dismutase family protein n=2 Tax=Stakelama tenebrarum TaxID=2711215 RepID=A0A6G6YAR9_9SPHN|nr:superoxide dismutase family protein [Sphingosinithalassobacter tenebrarum]
MVALATSAGCSSETTTYVDNSTDILANDVMPEPETGNMMMGNAMVPGGERAEAVLKTADDTEVGTAVIQQMGDGLQATVQVSGVPAGKHGAHVHMTGTCEAPDFKSAGGHWNPEGTQHGLENPQGAHAGDMPNLVVGADGSGSLTFMLPGGTFESLMEDDGAAFVVHAGEDDLSTDPAGDAGARFACGVFEAE